MLSNRLLVILPTQVEVLPQAPPLPHATLGIHDGRPIEKSISIEVFGVHQCMEKIQKELSKRSGVEVPEMLIEPLLRNGIGERSDGYKTNCGKLYRGNYEKVGGTWL